MEPGAARVNATVYTWGFKQGVLMDAVFAKLNYKGQKEIYVLNPPESFQDVLDTVSDEVTVMLDLDNLMETRKASFVLAFVTRQSEVDAISTLLPQTLADDAVFWFAYPKGTSKKYRCDFNRDTGWAKTSEAGWERVRQIAIDEDWTALRFRKPEHIKTMTRRF